MSKVVCILSNLFVCCQQRCYCGSSQCRQVVGGRNQKPELKSDHSPQPDSHLLASKVVVIVIVNIYIVFQN